MVERITSGEAVQPDLFEFDPVMRGKLDAVASAMDRINASMGNDTLILASQQYGVGDKKIKNSSEKGTRLREKPVRFSQAIKRDILSPEYSTRLGDFIVK